MLSVLVSQPMMIYLFNFVLYAVSVVAHEGPSYHTTTIYGRPTTWTTTFTPGVSPTYPPSGSSTYPPIPTETPTYSPSGTTYATTETSPIYPSVPPVYTDSSYPPVSPSVYTDASTTYTYPASSPYESSTTLPYPTDTSAIPTYTPSYPPNPSQGFTNNTVNVTDPRIVTYGDGWQTVTNSSCSGAPGKSCTETGRYLNFTFTGTAVYMLTSLSQNSGTCAVSLDNATPVSIDGYVPNQDPICVVAWSAYGLNNGSHNVIVTNLGQSQKATNAGQYNATVYESDGFYITTVTSPTSGSTALVATNSLYLLGTIMVALLVSC